MRSAMFIAALGAGVCFVCSAAADPATAPSSGASPAPPAEASPASPPSPSEAVEGGRPAKNAIYIEGLGPAIFYSINYDRFIFDDFALRVGFSYLSISGSANTSAGRTEESVSFISVPITISYLGVGSLQNMLELGAGATILHVGEGASVVNTDSSSTASGSATVIFPHGIVGYRFQPPGGGFVFRIGISPIFAGSAIPVLPWPYLSLGGAF